MSIRINSNNNSNNPEANIGLGISGIDSLYSSWPSSIDIVGFFFNSDNLSNRVAKVALANNGGYVQSYSRPFMSPASGSLEISTAATGFTPVGQVTVNYFIT